MLKNRVLDFFLLLMLTMIMVSCSAEIDPAVANTPFGMNAIRYEYIIVLLSMFAGWGLIIGGIALLLLGLTGRTCHGSYRYESSIGECQSWSRNGVDRCLCSYQESDEYQI